MSLQQRECSIPANTAHLNNVDLTLGQRRRRWANGKPALFQCVVFAGIIHIIQIYCNFHLTHTINFNKNLILQTNKCMHISYNYHQTLHAFLFSGFWGYPRIQSATRSILTSSSAHRRLIRCFLSDINYSCQTGWGGFSQPPRGLEG